MRHITTILTALILLSAAVTASAVDPDGGSPITGQTPDGGFISRKGGPGYYQYNYAPPSYPNTQAPYNGAYRSNPYDQGNGAPSNSSRDYYREEPSREYYREEPRRTQDTWHQLYGQPAGEWPY